MADNRWEKIGTHIYTDTLFSQAFTPFFIRCDEDKKCCYPCFCRFLYNRSGEWSDGTVPILATTAAGFTYIAFLIVSHRSQLLRWRDFLNCLHVLPDMVTTYITTVSKLRSVRQQACSEPCSCFFLSFSSGFSTLPRCTWAAVKFALAS